MGRMMNKRLKKKPIASSFKWFFFFRNKVVFALSSAPSKHREKVAFVQSQVYFSAVQYISDCFSTVKIILA